LRGNRGSIWLSGEGGTAPGHHPHLGCGDVLVWGAKLAGPGGTYEIAAWPPTGTRAVVATGTWAAPADGADAAVVAVVDGRALTDAAAEAGAPAHEQQGRHFGITVAQGDGVKHKTFWVDCPAPAGDTPQAPAAAPADGADMPPAGTGGDVPAGETDETVETVETAAAAPAPAPVTTPDTVVTLAAATVDEEFLAGDDATLVLGTGVSRPGALPLTGGNWAAIIATGMLLTGTGTLLVRRSRRAGDGDGIG
ncbi:MAG: hypothetical protein ACRDJO_01150, partial [Actinomycetota bacterium]